LKPAPVSVAQVNPKDREPLPGAGNPLDGKPMVPAAPGGIPAPKDPPLPPLGGASPVGSPPIAVPGPDTPAASPREGQAKHFIEQKYVCKQEDRNFADLSRRFYQSERYGEALLQYNREHPLVAPGVRQNPPQLQPGVEVHVPPLSELEKRYPGAIPGLQPLPPIKPAAPAAPGGLSSTGELSPVAVRPVPVPVPVPPVVAATAPEKGTPGAAPAAKGGQGTKVYRVQEPEGEYYYQVARRALGNPERWSEIWRLNPSIPPERPIPQGTTLVLPADARVTP
jgi:nucleoid-associated protein YgaU